MCSGKKGVQYVQKTKKKGQLKRVHVEKRLIQLHVAKEIGKDEYV